MKTHLREILIFYNADSQRDRKTVVHAKSLVNHVKAFTFYNGLKTRRSWQEVLNALDVHPKELLNKAHPFYQEHIRGREFGLSSWLKVIAHNPDIIKAPIAIRGKRAILCLTPTDIYQLTDQSAST